MTGERRARRFPRAAVAWGVAVFLVVTGATAANAYWTTQTSTISPAGTSGSVNVAINGAYPGDIVWTAASHSTTVPSTLTNTGSLDSNWSFVLTSSSPAAAATTLTVWPLNPGEQCTASSTPHDQVSATGSNPPALTGRFTAGTSVSICSRAAISDPGQVTYGGQKLDLNVAFAAAIGQWSHGQSAGVTISIADDARPTAPVVSTDRVSGYSTRVGWTASSDNAGVTGYRIYRNGTQVASVDASTRQWTDATLANNTLYKWEVEAFDAAGNATRSAAVSTRTLALVSNANYAIYYPQGARCVDAFGAGTAVGTNLIIWDCHYNANQVWTLRPSTDGTYLLESVNSTSTAIGSPNGNASQQLQLTAKSSASTRWLITADGTGFRLSNDSTGMCMDVFNNGTTNNTPVGQYWCNGNNAQFFQLQRR